MPARSAVALAKRRLLHAQDDAAREIEEVRAAAAPVFAEAAKAARLVRRAERRGSDAVERAERRVVSANRATQRLRSILDLLEYRHGTQGRRDLSVADQFALPVFAAIVWQLEIDQLSADDLRAEAARRTAELLPAVSNRTLDALCALTWRSLTMTNREVGDRLGFRLDEWRCLRQQLGHARKLQVQPAFSEDGSSLSEDDFRELVRQAKRAQEEARRRKAGAEAADQRRARQAASRAAWQALADQHGVKIDTVQRWARAGRLAPPSIASDPIRTRVPIQIKNSLLYQHATSDERDGRRGSKPRPDVTRLDQRDNGVGSPPSRFDLGDAALAALDAAKRAWAPMARALTDPSRVQSKNDPESNQTAALPAA